MDFKLFLYILILFSFQFNSLILSHRLECIAETECSSEGLNNQNSSLNSYKFGPKLLIILLDGFRWDYYSRQKIQLPGFSRFLRDGVQASWSEPIFPSMSFPTWTTIATGLYPENHNIIGNYMLYRPLENSSQPETVFQLLDNSTKLPFSAEPIWVTATRHNHKVYAANWMRCDVPFNGTVPAECKGYEYHSVNTAFGNGLITAIKRLKSGYSLAMVFDDLIDHVGHSFGPDSRELQGALIERDAHIQEMLLSLRISGMEDKVNVIITSDHGMTQVTQNVKPVCLSDYVNEDDLYKALDYGAIVQISAVENRTEALGESLSKIPGVLVYPKLDIPEDFHFKRGKFVLDFLLVAQQGYKIVGLKSSKQVPNDPHSSSTNPYIGAHGYHNMTEMRTIFFARGPAFKKGLTHSPIGVIDQYQIFMKVLGLDPLPHNGTWENVKDMLA